MYRNCQVPNTPNEMGWSLTTWLQNLLPKVTKTVQQAQTVVDTLHPQAPAVVTAPEQSPGLPGWVLPAAIVGAAFILLRRR